MLLLVVCGVGQSVVQVQGAVACSQHYTEGGGCQGVLVRPPILVCVSESCFSAQERPGSWGATVCGLWSNTGTLNFLYEMYNVCMSILYSSQLMKS